MNTLKVQMKNEVGTLNKIFSLIANYRVESMGLKRESDKTQLLEVIFEDELPNDILSEIDKLDFVLKKENN